MTQALLKALPATTHRVDLSCQASGFSTPPFDVHIKFLPAPDGGWTVLAHAAAGKLEALARWLRLHPFIEWVHVAPGLAPKTLGAKATELPPAWATVDSFVKVHHLDLTSYGHASWFVEGVREKVRALVQHLPAMAGQSLAEDEVRLRPVHASRSELPISRRQFEALCSAVAFGYYEIPHRVDLRTLAGKTGVSLGSVAELLRRAEGAVLTHYVDSRLLGWPVLADAVFANPFRSMENPRMPEGDPVQRVSNAQFISVHATQSR